MPDGRSSFEADAGPGFEDSPEYRARIAEAAKNLGIMSLKSQEMLYGIVAGEIDNAVAAGDKEGEELLRARLAEISMSGSTPSPSIEQTISELQTRGVDDVFGRIEDE